MSESSVKGSSVTGESSASKPKMTTVFRELTLGDVPRSCAELLAELRAPARLESQTLRFEGVGGRDVYNITAPFELDGKTLIMGRVEQRETEFSEIVVFEKAGSNRWVPCFTHPDFDGLQDPCVTWSGKELIVGGVRYPVRLPHGGMGCRMDFYRGSTLESLRHFLTGPPGMKDIRFRELPDGSVAVFSRPQGVVGGLGEIGFTKAGSWEGVTAELIANAPLFKGQLLKEEWGGANEAHVLSNGRLGVLGHIACFDARRNRHYYPMAFTLDPVTRESSAIRIIAQRSFFPVGEAKRPDLEDVVFSGGIVRNGDGTASLYAGTSDTAAAVVKLPDPFTEFEA